MRKDIAKLIESMTLEEKASLCSGLDVWHTKPIERLGIPSVMVSDGPSGLRKQASDASDHLGLNGSIVAVAFPSGSALAATFDRDLLEELGENLGIAAKAEGLHTVLGPAINMKRSPLCGRNFEYMSEDPFAAGELAASYVKGMQRHNVGVCVKHFAANNQEFHRMTTDTAVSERALREIYLSAFEKAAKKGKAWSFMCSYNMINGEYTCENKWLLDDVLRQEWKSDSIVITDWGAMNDRVKALRAGLELEMPTSAGIRDRQIVKAVSEGRLSEKTLDREVGRLLEWLFKGLEKDPHPVPYNKDKQHDFAVKLAKEAAVLLKNDRKTLPLSPKRKIAFIGTFAKDTRFQGGGSSHVNAYKVSSALEECRKLAEISYLPGWNDDGETESKALSDAAVTAAMESDVTVVFAGLPDSWESEGFDRKHMQLPACQNNLIARIADAARGTRHKLAVVLYNGSPVEMPWVDDVDAILEMNLAGEGSGEAAAAILFGKANPCGYLSETYPLSLKDNPSYLWFPGTGDKVTYNEDVYIGYRWYDSRDMDVLFPFGHGLSYTTFDLGNPEIRKTGKQQAEISVDVSNTGKRAGKAVVQIYVAPPKGKVDRPVHELKEFAKIHLKAGETRTLKFSLDSRAFSCFDEEIHDWYAESGTYTIEAGFSSRDIRCKGQVNIHSPARPFHFSDTTSVGDVIAAGKGDVIKKEVDMLFGMFGVNTEESGSAMNTSASNAIIMEMPVHSFLNFLPVDDDILETLKEKLTDKEPLQ